MSINRFWSPENYRLTAVAPLPADNTIFDMILTAQNDVYLAPNLPAKREVVTQLLTDLKYLQHQTRIDDIEIQSMSTMFPGSEELPPVPVDADITIKGTYGSIRIFNKDRRGVPDIALGIAIKDAEVMIPHAHPDFEIPADAMPFPVTLISGTRGIWY